MIAARQYNDSFTEKHADGPNRSLHDDLPENLVK